MAVVADALDQHVGVGAGQRQRPATRGDGKVDLFAARIGTS